MAKQRNETRKFMSTEFGAERTNTIPIWKQNMFNNMKQRHNYRINHINTDKDDQKNGDLNFKNISNNHKNGYNINNNNSSVFNFNPKKNNFNKNNNNNNDNNNSFNFNSNEKQSKNMNINSNNNNNNNNNNKYNTNNNKNNNNNHNNNNNNNNINILCLLCKKNNLKYGLIQKTHTHGYYCEKCGFKFRPMKNNNNNNETNMLKYLKNKLCEYDNNHQNVHNCQGSPQFVVNYTGFLSIRCSDHKCYNFKKYQNFI